MGTLKTIWKNRKQIIEGITNTIIRDETIEVIAALRHSVCDGCSSKGDNCVAPGTGPCCGECGCSLTFKTRSLASECPLGKWKSFSTVEEEDELNNLKN